MIYESSHINSNASSYLDGILLYKKAVEFFKTCRSLVTLVSDNKNILDLERSKATPDRLCSDLVLHTIKLVEYISTTESTNNQVTKSENIAFIEHTISKIKIIFNAFERNIIQNVEIISLLKEEINELHRIFWEWSIDKR